MKYLNTYKELHKFHKYQPIYITNVPINDKIFDIIKIHYNLNDNQFIYAQTPLNKLHVISKIKEKYNTNHYENDIIYIKISKLLDNKTYYFWDISYKYYPFKHDIKFTIEEWLEKYYQNLTIDEIIQSNKMGLL